MRLLIRQIGRLMILVLRLITQGRFYPRSMEAIVVSLLILLLLMVFVPAILVSRDQARRDENNARLRQFGLGLHSYHDTFRSFPVSPSVRLHITSGPPKANTARKSRKPPEVEPEAISPL